MQGCYLKGSLNKSRNENKSAFERCPQCRIKINVTHLFSKFGANINETRSTITEFAMPRSVWQFKNWQFNNLEKRVQLLNKVTNWTCLPLFADNTSDNNILTGCMVRSSPECDIYIWWKEILFWGDERKGTTETSRMEECCIENEMQI